MITRTWPMVGGLAVVLAGLSAVAQNPGKPAVLRIGTAAATMDAVKPDQKDTARDTLKDFIKKETGFENELITLKDSKEVCSQLADGKIELALFEGFALAWAEPDYPKFKPLAIAVNEYPYHYVDIVVQADNKATDFGKLQGRSFSLPSVSQGFVRLFVEREAKASGKDLKTFFSKITTPDNVEDALDNVVDGVVDATAADQLAVLAYKRRKPGRFRQLRELTRSPAFPPAAVVYQQGTLDDATLKQFRDGLLSARNKEQGKLLLNLYKLTAFESVPKDFERMLEETRKRFPLPENP